MTDTETLCDDTTSTKYFKHGDFPSMGIDLIKKI